MGEIAGVTVFAIGIPWYSWELGGPERSNNEIGATTAGMHQRIQ